MRKKGLIGAILLVVVVLLGNFVLQWALVLVLKTETPLHTPISGSMEPTLKIGDLLIIQGGLKAEDIYAHSEDGDIIIFHDPRNPGGTPIVHRAIDKVQENGKWQFVTKGDNNPYPDSWLVPEDYLIGKVIFAVPMLGFLLRAMDETGIYLGRYFITLRTILIIVLIISFFYLEFKGSEEQIEKSPETRKEGRG